jgi:hypothetical protein
VFEVPPGSSIFTKGVLDDPDGDGRDSFTFNFPGQAQITRPVAIDGDVVGITLRATDCP